MTNIEKSNRLIAEFMGMQKTDIGWYDNEELIELPNTRDNTFDFLQFHESWDWLMPVVEKIDALNYSVDITSLGIGNNKMMIYSGGNLVVQSKFQRSKLESVYEAIIAFIEWHNVNDR